MEGTFKQVRELVNSGYVEILEDHSAPPESPVAYLALHVVTKPDKPGKFRVTQDAAAKVGGISLNDYLLNGL